MQNFMVFCTNLPNMGMILERQGITIGKNQKPGIGMGKNQKPGMVMGIPVPVTALVLDQNFRL
jgi:hypothetical protein